MPLISTMPSPIRKIIAFVPPISLRVVSLCSLWYTLSSVSSQITKSILNDFPFPLALGEFQFFLVFSSSLTTMLLLPHCHKIHALFPKGSVPSLNGPAVLKPNRHIITTVLPLGIFQFFGKLFSHSATALVPVSTVAAIKTLSPLILVTTYRFVYKVHFPSSTYFSLIPLIAGILLIVLADAKETLISTTSTHTQYVGIFYAALSLIVFVAQNIYGKTVFTHDQKHINDHSELALGRSASSNFLPVSQKDLDQNPHQNEKEREKVLERLNLEFEMEKSSAKSKGNPNIPTFPKIRNQYDKLTLLLYISAFGALISFPWFLFIEAHHFLPRLQMETEVTEAQLVHIPWKLLFISGFAHFNLSLLTFHLLGSIPTLTYSIASMMKKITVIVVSMIYTGNSISLVQWLGLSLTTAGLYAYDRWGARRNSG